MLHVVFLCLAVAECTSGDFLQRITPSTTPHNVDSLKNYNISKLHVIYPMRRYRSPQLGPVPDSVQAPVPDSVLDSVLDSVQAPVPYSVQAPILHNHLETGTYMTYVHPVHLTNHWRRRVSMRDGVDAMMDSLLSVRRLPV